MATVEGDEMCFDNKNMIDRLSTLPDQLSHKILSLLTIEDLARLGCVSKRCNELYMLTPSLDIKFYNLDLDTSTCNKRLQVLNSLDRFLVHRGGHKLKYFRVSWVCHSTANGQALQCFCDDEIYQMLLRWIRNAVSCNVEKLHVKIVSPEDVSTISTMSMTFIFLCESLRSLKLKMYCTIHEAPSFDVSSNLQYLKLQYVCVKDERFFKWISSCCRFLEKLVLADVRGINTVTIESSSLKIFEFWFPVDIYHLVLSCEKLEAIYIDWRFDDPSNRSANVFAPNLKKLWWYGNVMNQRNLGNLESLEEVRLQLEPEVDYKNVYGLLCSLCRVQVLAIDRYTIQALFWEGCRPIQLHNVWSLEMNMHVLSNDILPPVVSILKGMPNLCTLYMEFMNVNYSSFLCDHVSVSGFNLSYWKKQGLAFSKLEEVHIDLCEGSNVMHFVRYILRNAPALQYMIVTYPSKQLSVVRKLRKEKPLSNAKVIFQKGGDVWRRSLV